MWPDRVSNPRPLTYKSGALPTALRGLANTGLNVFIHLKVYGCTSIFSAMFSKGDNFCDFLFAYLVDEVFPKCGLRLKESICSL